MSIDRPLGTFTVADLRPWQEVQALLPPLSQAQFEELKQSIQQDGLRIPLLALPDGRLIDGVHRHLCCQTLGIAPQVTVLDVDEAEAFRLALTLNLARRHLGHDQLQELRRWQR
ncbi:MAG: ParB N-terminal domain-containing protein, partial [Bacillota bacterium]|nr:ParB N-terminal domain-containing protein [Bacillota bacterium]